MKNDSDDLYVVIIVQNFETYFNLQWISYLWIIVNGNGFRLTNVILMFLMLFSNFPETYLQLQFGYSLAKDLDLLTNGERQVRFDEILEVLC